MNVVEKKKADEDNARRQEAELELVSSVERSVLYCRGAVSVVWCCAPVALRCVALHRFLPMLRRVVSYRILSLVNRVAGAVDGSL
jgi:hypothetical protein